MTEDDSPAELAERLEDAERTLDVVTDVVDRIRDPESSEGVHPHPDIAERLERLEIRIDALSTLVLKISREETSANEAETTITTTPTASTRAEPPTTVAVTPATKRRGGTTDVLLDPASARSRRGDDPRSRDLGEPKARFVGSSFPSGMAIGEPPAPPIASLRIERSSELQAFSTSRFRTMVRDLTLKDETYEQLSDRQRDDESAADVVRRLLDTSTEQNSPSAAGATGGIETVDSDRIEQLAPSESDALAKRAMTVDEVRAATEEQLSAGAYIRREYGVDPEDYGSESAFIDAVREARRDPEGE